MCTGLIFRMTILVFGAHQCTEEFPRFIAVEGEAVLRLFGTEVKYIRRVNPS